MTRKKVSLLLCLATLTAFSACSNSEQQAAVERQRLIEQREQRESKETEQAKAEEAAKAERDRRTAEDEERARKEAEEAAKPVEPEKTIVYVAFISGNRNSVQCNDIANHSCGFSLTGCDDEFEYRCITNLKFTTKEVIKTENNGPGGFENWSEDHQ